MLLVFKLIIIICNFTGKKPQLPDIPRLRQHFPELSWDGDVKRLLAYSKIRRAKAKCFLLKRGEMHAQQALRKLSRNAKVSMKETTDQNKTESSATVVPWKRAKLSSEEIEGKYFMINLFFKFLINNYIVIYKIKL